MSRPIAILIAVLICVSLGELALFRVDWRPLIETKNDLRSMIEAADAFLRHEPIYDATNLCLGCYPSPFTYLPGNLLPFIPLVGLDPYLAFAIFTLLSILVFMAGTGMLLHQQIGYQTIHILLLGLGVLLFPAVDNMLWGQSQLLLTGMLALALVLPPVAGGIVLGIASYYKLYPALLIGAAIVAGDRRRGLASLATGTLLLAASLALFGLETHLEFLRFLSRLLTFFTGPSHLLANYSIRNHLSIHALPQLSILMATLLLPCGWAAGVWRLRKEAGLCYSFTLGAMILISPIVWRSYFLLGVPIAILLYSTIRSQRLTVQLLYVISVVATLTAGLNIFVQQLALWPPIPMLGIVTLCGLCLFLGRYQTPHHRPEKMETLA